jgi:type II secretory pathway pseudopilin PulG
MAYCAHCGSHVAQVSNAPCASCGYPTNGAPPRPVARGGTNTVAIVIGVVAGIFVIVAILGILAAIAIPNFLTAMQRSKQKRTMADMRAVAMALEAHAEEKKAWPAGHSVSEIAGELGTKVPTTDGWENLLGYEALPDGGGYVIVSGGADKKFEHGSLLDYEAQKTSHFDCDIVLANGEFVQYPGGN